MLADRVRQQRNFNHHVRLRPTLLKWYAALKMVLPDHVRFGLTVSLPVVRAAAKRHRLAAFNAMVARLP